MSHLYTVFYKFLIYQETTCKHSVCNICSKCKNSIAYHCSSFSKMERCNNFTCSMDSFVTSLHVTFRAEIIEDWNDPLDSILLKLLTVLVYIVNTLASIIMLSFVSFETGGNAGHYRTVINQLLSCGYGGVSLFFI